MGIRLLEVRLLDRARRIRQHASVENQTVRLAPNIPLHCLATRIPHRKQGPAIEPSGLREQFGPRRMIRVDDEQRSSRERRNLPGLRRTKPGHLRRRHGHDDATRRLNRAVVVDLNTLSPDHRDARRDLQWPDVELPLRLPGTVRSVRLGIALGHLLVPAAVRIRGLRLVQQVRRVPLVPRLQPVPARRQLQPQPRDGDQVAQQRHVLIRLHVNRARWRSSATC